MRSNRSLGVQFVILKLVGYQSDVMGPTSSRVLHLLCVRIQFYCTEASGCTVL